MRARWAATVEEFREHLPYTLLAAAVALGLLGAVTFLARLMDRQSVLPSAAQNLFHTMHFFHLFLSAIATTAMFWRYDRRRMKAVLIGVVGTVVPCGASDIFFPLLGGWFMGASMEAHICFLEHPLLVWPFVLTGVFVGFLLPPVRQSTHLAHGGHVLLSSAASGLYLISFGMADWIRFAPFVFLLLVVAVMVPCCTSDIVFPLMLTHPDEADTHAIHRAV